MRALALLIALLLVSAAPVRANMRAWDEAGDRGGEPGPLLADVNIVHESLSIDMRPVNTPREPVRIRASYQVRNDGPKRTVEMFFVAPGLRAGQVRHQGRRIPARMDERAEAMVPDQTGQR